MDYEDGKAGLSAERSRHGFGLNVYPARIKNTGM